MNNLKLKRLSDLNLIWIDNYGYWVYDYQTCQKVKFERKDEELVFKSSGRRRKSC